MHWVCNDMLKLTRCALGNPPACNDMLKEDAFLRLHGRGHGGVQKAGRRAQGQDGATGVKLRLGRHWAKKAKKEGLPSGNPIHFSH